MVAVAVKMKLLPVQPGLVPVVIEIETAGATDELDISMSAPLSPPGTAGLLPTTRIR